MDTEIRVSTEKWPCRRKFSRHSCRESSYPHSLYCICIFSFRFTVRNSVDWWDTVLWKWLLLLNHFIVISYGNQATFTLLPPIITCPTSLIPAFFHFLSQVTFAVCAMPLTPVTRLAPLLGSPAHIPLSEGSPAHVPLSEGSPAHAPLSEGSPAHTPLSVCVLGWWQTAVQKEVILMSPVSLFSEVPLQLLLFQKQRQNKKHDGVFQSKGVGGPWTGHSRLLQTTHSI